MKKTEIADNKREINGYAVTTGILLGVRVLIYAVLFIWNELYKGKGSFIEGKGLARIGLTYLAVPGVLAAVTLFWSACLRIPEAAEATDVRTRKSFSVVKKCAVAAAIAAQALYWLYIILSLFSGLQWLPGACSLAASALTVVFVIVFYLMKNYERMKRKNDQTGLSRG